ncbi:MAG TPA: NTP transferase domain-containing protein, partial [Pseudorhizobium sp.]|nr:NTP transferase domain-containing protein [Pseudorhizobium sp.]
MSRTCLAVILAAGDSTRMKSSMSKVLHPIAGLPMIGHVMKAVASAGIADVALVLGRDAEAVAAAANKGGMTVRTVMQTERLGTGHAVLSARELIAEGFDEILVTYGDA